MKLKIRIILAITLIFSSIPAYFQNQRQSPLTNLDNFISNVSSLITLTNGIVRQSKITHGFRKETSEYFNSTTSKFNALFKLNLMDVADSVTNFYAAVQKLDLSSDFKSLEKPVSLLMNLAGDSGNLDIQKSDIQNYVKLLNDTENLLDVGLDFEPPDFRILRKVEICLIASETLAEIGSCQKSMGLLNVSKVEIPFKRLDKLLEKLAPIQKLIDSFKRIKSLGLVVYAESEFSNDNGVFQNLSESLKNASVSLKGVEELMSGNVKNLAQKLKTAVLYSKIQPNEEQREKMNEFFALFNSTWFGKFLGKENFRKLKVGLQPFLNYTVDTEKVEKIVEDSRDFQKASERILKYIYIIAAWDEPYSIQSSLITAVEKCTPSLSNATFDVSEFRKTWDFSIQLVTDLDQYILSIKNVIKIKEDIIQGSKDLKENLEKWKLENWHQVQFHLDQFLKQNSSKSVKNLMSNLELAFSVHTKYLQKIQFLNKTLANHPDPKILEDTLDSVDTENILSISKCLSEKNFQVGYIEDTLKGADRLKRFKKRITSEDMNSLKKYMEGVFEISKLLKSMRKVMKETLSAEAKALNGFSNAESILKAFEKGRKAIETINRVPKNLPLLQEALNIKFEYSNEFWNNWKARAPQKIRDTIQHVKDLEKFIEAHLKSNFSSIGLIFKEASRVPGLDHIFDRFESFKIDVSDLKEAREVLRTLESIQNLDLGFTHHSSELQAASISFEVLKTFLDGLFGKKTILATEKTRWKSIGLPWFQIVLFCIGGLFSVILIVFVSCSCSKYGRRKWRKLYLERFATQETRELQWRYSFWLDQESDKNMLCEAVREVNFEQVKALIDKGVFVNVYNPFGNTPLHAAAKYGHVQIVEYLIRNGADRNAYNVENKTAEQLLAESVQTTTVRLMLTTAKSTTSVSEGGASSKSQQTENKTFTQIEMIFEKLRGKTFRQRVPDLLPTMLYRIRIDSRLADIHAYGPFTEMYKGNVTDQMSGVTHFIVPTDSNGVFESDDFGYIMCVFLPTLLMKQQWMEECTERGKKAFRDDYKYRIERVKYRGTSYDTVVKWAMWIHKQCIPFLFGVHLHLAVEDMSQMERIQLRQLVEMHGAVWMEEMMAKKNFNLESHPYHHFNLGPLWVIHDGKRNLSNLKNDPDRMYTLMTFPEFVAFMLKLECHYDPKRRVPIPVTNQVEDSEA